jgi:hypothetical protein
MSASTRESPSTGGNLAQIILILRGQRVVLDANLALRSQIAASKRTAVGRGGRRSRAYAFTEHGALMAATVLNSPRAAAILTAIRSLMKPPTPKRRGIGFTAGSANTESRRN